MATMPIQQAVVGFSWDTAVDLSRKEQPNPTQSRCHQRPSSDREALEFTGRRYPASVRRHIQWQFLRIEESGFQDSG